MTGRARRRLDARTARAVLFAVAAVLQGGCGAMFPSSSGGARVEARADVFALSTAADRAYRESRWIDAAHGYTKLTEAVPDDAYAWFRLGNTHARQGDYDRAIRAYEASLARDAAQPRPWFNLATTHLLHAQSALVQARDRLRPDDPARAMIDARLDRLRTLVHGRIEDVPGAAPRR